MENVSRFNYKYLKKCVETRDFEAPVHLLQMGQRNPELLQAACARLFRMINSLRELLSVFIRLIIRDSRRERGTQDRIDLARFLRFHRRKRQARFAEQVGVVIEGERLFGRLDARHLRAALRPDRQRAQSDC